MNIIDISRTLLKTIEYPGDPKSRHEQVRTIEDGGCNLSAVYACVHTGTHADAPCHFIDGGETIEEADLSKFIGPCTVIEVPQGVISGEYVNRFFPKDCERLLIKGNGLCHFMDSAAYEAVELGIKLIGTDADSVGRAGDQTEPHRAFLRNGVAILEGLDLSKVAPGNYFLMAAPVKMGAVDGAPVRAVLVDDYILWNNIK